MNDPCKRLESALELDPGLNSIPYPNPVMDAVDVEEGCGVGVGAETPGVGVEVGIVAGVSFIYHCCYHYLK